MRRTVADLREALIACEQLPPSVEHFLANIPRVAIADEIPIVATSYVDDAARHSGSLPPPWPPPSPPAASP